MLGHSRPTTDNQKHALITMRLTQNTGKMLPLVCSRGCLPPPQALPKESSGLLFADIKL